jgi:hypothetical protein
VLGYSYQQGNKEKRKRHADKQTDLTKVGKCARLITTRNTGTKKVSKKFSKRLDKKQKV